MPEGEEEEQEIENLLEKGIKENFPNLVKEIDIQVQEAQRVPNKMDANSPTLRHIIKMPNVGERWWRDRWEQSPLPPAHGNT